MLNVHWPSWLLRIIDIPKATPDARRRSRLLNIILAGFFVLSLMAFAFSGLNQLLNPNVVLRETAVTLIVSAVMLFFITAVYIINYRYSETAAAAIFLFLFTFTLFFADTPQQTFWGRNLLTLVIPIITASVILKPRASFIVALFISAVFIIFPQIYTPAPPAQPIDINFIGILTFFGISLISWLSATTLETTLANLRILNEELDLRVAERTNELEVANNELRQARDVALEASRYKSELTARASHELRTPLGSILGFTEMLRSGFDGPISQNQEGRLTKIITTTNHLTQLINDWLDHAQLDAGQLKINNEPFSIREVAFRVEEMMQVLAFKKQLELTFAVDPTLPHLIEGDAERISQLLINLIGNAIKYTPNGFVKVNINCLNEQRWQIEVKDSGVGIPQHALPFIFEPFHQADSSTTRRHEGFGLGLSIVKQLVDLMDGSLSVESKEQEGSTFRVEFPIIYVPNNNGEIVN